MFSSPGLLPCLCLGPQALRGRVGTMLFGMLDLNSRRKQSGAQRDLGVGGPRSRFLPVSSLTCRLPSQGVLYLLGKLVGDVFCQPLETGEADDAH